MTMIERLQQLQNVTWANSATSNDVQLEGLAGGLLYNDASFTGTALTFSVSLDGTTYALLQNDGADLSIDVDAGKVAALPAELFGAKYVKFVSTATETCTGKFRASS